MLLSQKEMATGWMNSIFLIDPFFLIVGCLASAASIGRMEGGLGHPLQTGSISPSPWPVSGFLP